MPAILTNTIPEDVPALGKVPIRLIDLVPYWVDFMLTMLPQLCCQTIYECACFRSGYWLVTYSNNKESCGYKGNSAHQTLPKANWPDDDICISWCSVIGSGIPSLSATHPRIFHQPHPASQIGHSNSCWSLSLPAATGCTGVVMLSLFPECYEACIFYPSLIQVHHLITHSPNVFSTECCPAGIRHVSLPLLY